GRSRAKRGKREEGRGKGGSENKKAAATNAEVPVPWSRFSAWLECVCVVTFDLELGQAIEVHKLCKTSICYLSFPDSYSGCLGDTQLSFRLRQSVGRSSSWFGHEDAYNRDAPVTLQKEHAHFHGYVYFRQVKDASVKRGYFQKSLVVVSRLPFVNLFHSLLQVIAPEYFEKHEPCLETVCNEIDQWPAPVPGQTLNLPVMGVVMQVRILWMEKLFRTNIILIHFTALIDLHVIRCFQSVLIHVQMLWELMLLGEPVVVMAPSPTVSSETVLALVSAIAPLRYCGDYRPYFTIHDSEFKEYTTRTQAPPNVILGVTNPFFIKTFQCWPHIIRLGDLKMSGDLPKQVKVKKLTFLHKDKAFIKRLLKGIQKKRPSEVQSAILRRHLLEQTESFILPLERYLESLMPLQRSMSPWKTPPQIRSFSQDEFMKTLEQAGPQLTLKGDWTGLYRRFFRSPNFDGWYRLRHREMIQKVECLHLEAICAADLLTWTKDKSEVEIVDLILKLREKLMRARKHQLPVKEELLERLEQSIQTIISSLPEDLQTLLHRQ
uniref:DENN/MADD domain containing 6B n=1 Tax=Sinocyclocheilus anshuiensis TaxID=1608454 RepID=A0A671SWI8_9TELE